MINLQNPSYFVGKLHMLNHIFTTLVCALGFSLTIPAYANNPPSSAKKVITKKKTSNKASANPVASALTKDEEVLDTASAASTDFHCELGNKLTIYTHASDSKQAAIRWKNRLVQLTRVDTSTGANRYESHKHGLVWIGIPAKGILLDSKKGQQLANECKNHEQLKPAVASAPAAPAAPAAETTPVAAPTPTPVTAPSKTEEPVKS